MNPDNLKYLNRELFTKKSVIQANTLIDALDDISRQSKSSDFYVFGIILAVLYGVTGLLFTTLIALGMAKFGWPPILFLIAGLIGFVSLRVSEKYLKSRRGKAQNMAYKEIKLRLTPAVAKGLRHDIQNLMDQNVEDRNKNWTFFVTVIPALLVYPFWNNVATILIKEQYNGSWAGAFIALFILITISVIVFAGFNNIANRVTPRLFVSDYVRNNRALQFIDQL